MMCVKDVIGRDTAVSVGVGATVVVVVVVVVVADGRAGSGTAKGDTLEAEAEETEETEGPKLEEPLAIEPPSPLLPFAVPCLAVGSGSMSATETNSLGTVVGTITGAVAGWMISSPFLVDMTMGPSLFIMRDICDSRAMRRISSARQLASSSLASSSGVSLTSVLGTSSPRITRSRSLTFLASRRLNSSDRYLATTQKKKY